MEPGSGSSLIPARIFKGRSHRCSVLENTTRLLGILESHLQFHQTEQNRWMFQSITAWLRLERTLGEQLIQPFAASRVSQSLHPGPGVCLGWIKARTHRACECSFGLSRNWSWELVNISHLFDWLDEYEKETSDRKGEWKCFLNHLKVGGEEKKKKELFSAIFFFSQFCRPPSSGRFSLLLKRSCL